MIHMVSWFENFLDYLTSSMYYRACVISWRFLLDCVSFSRNIANNGYDVDFWFKGQMLDLLNPILTLPFYLEALQYNTTDFKYQLDCVILMGRLLATYHL